MTPEVKTWYATHGYTLLADSAPAVGVPIKAAKVVQDRGFGGVILNTRRIEVDAVRLVDRYHDLSNNEEVVSSELEAWRTP